jgi:uncharacterized lipoprotein YbaY
MKQKLITKRLLLLLLAITMMENLLAQSTQGTDFYVSFGNIISYTSAAVALNLQVQISAEVPVSGVLHFTDETLSDVPFTLAGGEIFTYRIDTQAKK